MTWSWRWETICLVEFGQYMYCFFKWDICSSRKPKHRDGSSDMEY